MSLNIDVRPFSWNLIDPHVCEYTDAKTLVSLPKIEQAAQKLIAFTQLAYAQMEKDKHNAAFDFHLKIKDLSQKDSYKITVFAPPSEPQSKCEDCGLEMQMNQMIEITSEIVLNSSLTFKILRLHRIVVHREFGPDEAKSARQLDAFHKLLYRTGAPVPPKENRGCQLL